MSERPASRSQSSVRFSDDTLQEPSALIPFLSLEETQLHVAKRLAPRGNHSEACKYRPFASMLALAWVVFQWQSSHLAKPSRAEAVPTTCEPEIASEVLKSYRAVLARLPHTA